MFQFEQAHLLWWLLLIPVGILVFWLSGLWKTKMVSASVDLEIIKRLYPNWSRKKEWLKTIMILLALAMLCVAWANPQWGSRKQKVKAKSSDVVIALDISQSMMAEDVSPNRIERSKRFLTELLKSLRGERVGLIFFAGGAYLQMPLSNDYASAELYIKSASPKQAGTQGTVIADAIALAGNLFGEENATQKALIVISDGENHESEAIEAARKMREKGTFVFTLGVGTTEGAYVPFIERGKTVYKRDKSGQAVSSALNVQLLQDIAKAGGGEFYMIDETFSAIRKLDSEIERLEKQEVEQRSFTDYNSYFQYFLLLALLLFFIEYFISNHSNKKGMLKRWLGI
jgi:Ca-activated chloride channel family protein